MIIEQTEALVAIDVNSGTFRVGDDAEETAYQTNLQAAKEIARQLRLRNLGGVIINDFIDMKEERHRRNLEETFRKSLRRDRSRTKILKTSAFGVIEMTRQRVQTSLKRTAYSECTHCRSTGLVKTPQSMCIDVMRTIQLSAHRKLAKTVELAVHVDGDVLAKQEATRTPEMGGRRRVNGFDQRRRLAGIPEIRGLDNNGTEVPFDSGAFGNTSARETDDRDDRGGEAVTPGGIEVVIVAEEAAMIGRGGRPRGGRGRGR